MMTDIHQDLTFVPPTDQKPGTVYRWLNTNERHLRTKIYEGWKLCKFEDSDNPLTGLPGQSTETPTGGVLRQRGDLILAEMPADLHDRKVKGKIREARERASGQVTATLERVNDEMRAAARNAGLTNVPKQLVFREDPTDN